jgi:hypothetical protein
MTNLTLTVTIDQATSMTRLLDIATRIHLGQFGEIDYLAKCGEIKHRNGNNLGVDDCDLLKNLIDKMQHIFGFSGGSSFGIGSPHVCMDAHCGYEIKKVIEKALAEHRDPNPSFRGVNYDGLTVRYTNDPAPVAVIQNSQTNKETE